MDLGGSMQEIRRPLLMKQHRTDAVTEMDRVHGKAAPLYLKELEGFTRKLIAQVVALVATWLRLQSANAPLEAKYLRSVAQVRAYEVLTGNAYTRMGTPLQQASLRDYFGQTPDGFRCQRYCPNCDVIMVTEQDEDGRDGKKTYTLPLDCALLVLGFEKDPVVTIHWL